MFKELNQKSSKLENTLKNSNDTAIFIDNKCNGIKDLVNQFDDKIKDANNNANIINNFVKGKEELNKELKETTKNIQDNQNLINTLQSKINRVENDLHITNNEMNNIMNSDLRCFVDGTAYNTITSRLNRIIIDCVCRNLKARGFLSNLDIIEVNNQ